MHDSFDDPHHHVEPASRVRPRDRKEPLPPGERLAHRPRLRRRPEEWMVGRPLREEAELAAVRVVVRDTVGVGIAFVPPRHRRDKDILNHV